MMRDDLIRRSTAIEAAERKDWVLEAMDSVQDGEMNRTQRAIARILAGLPTAKPDLECDGCKYEWRSTGPCDICSRSYTDRYEVKYEE
jgi:hypothetical protein